MSLYFRRLVGLASSRKDGDELKLEHGPIASRSNDTAETYGLRSRTSRPQSPKLPFHRTAYTALDPSEDQQIPLQAEEVPSPDRPQTPRKSSEHLPPPVKHEAGFMNKWWVLEVLAWIMSLIALGAIISVLAVYNGRLSSPLLELFMCLMIADKPLPKWPYSITINSLISVFSTIFKACMAVPLTEGKQYQQI